MARKIKYVLGGYGFTSDKAVKAHAKEILNRVMLGEPLKGDDDRFIRDLFDLHPDRDQKLCGTDADWFYVRKHPDYPNRNFMVRRSDGESVHFSYLYAVKPMPRAQWFAVAGRNAVDDQKWAYRDEYFKAHAGAEGRAPCERTNALILPTECDVHHAGPLEFKDIVGAYLEERGLEPEEVEYLGTTDGEAVLRFADDQLANDFARFHEERATLQVVSREEHRKLRAKR